MTVNAGETVDMPPASGGSATPRLDDGPALAAGAQLGSYRIVSLAGEGGMGRVYVAEHAVIKRKVALKVLRPSLVDSQRSVERFFAEAEAVNRIRHPGIVEVTDLFVVDGVPCIVMELLEGRTLARDIAAGALAPERVVAVGKAIAAALAATHAAGVVHRDLKPDNVVIVNDDMSRPDAIKVLDFGVAKLADGPSSSSGQTAAGAILGTPEYMSPEQLAGKPVDARADIYTLGVTLYHASTGRVPFQGDSFGDFVVKHLTQEPPPLGDDVPPGLARAIGKMIAKEPADRPASMNEVSALLDEALTWRPPRRQSIAMRAAAFAAGVVAVAIGAWQLGVFSSHEGVGIKPAALNAPAAMAPAAIAPAPAPASDLSAAVVEPPADVKTADANAHAHAHAQAHANANANAAPPVSPQAAPATKERREKKASGASAAPGATTTKRGVIDPFGGEE